MTIYEFYTAYILTRKARLETQFRTSIDVSIRNDSIWLNHIPPRAKSPMKISYEAPITCLAH